jgi:hypothetical protein
LPLVLLSEERFAAEVRAALRGYASPTALAQSPLLRSRVVAERTGTAAGVPERVDALRGILHSAALALTSADPGGRLATVLRRTYLEPASKQLAAAGELGLSFDTYRRYLGRALELLVATLWRREIGEP